MNQDQELKKVLVRPSPPDELETKIRTNWQQQLSETTTKSNRNRRLIVASMAVVVSLFCGVFVLDATPDPVRFAIKDISKDTILNIGVSTNYLEQLKALHINPPPDALKILLSKYCKIDGKQTLHLHIAGMNQGSVHLFIHHGEINSRFWQYDQGETSSLTWQLITPREHLSVIVMRTSDMKSENVKKLLQSMFYA